MQIVIDIPEETYKEVTWRGLHLCPRDEHALVDAIKKGTPLPKGHGRLIDVSSLITVTDIREDGQEFTYVSYDDINDAPTIIEADREYKCEHI